MRDIVEEEDTDLERCILTDKLILNTYDDHCNHNYKRKEISADISE